METIKNYGIPFLIGGTVIAGIKWTSHHMPQKYAAVVGALPLGLLSTLFIIEANKNKIILASPSTLVSVLKIIDNMWSINERNKNSFQIATTSLEIYAQVEKVYSAFESAGLELRKSM